MYAAYHLSMLRPKFVADSFHFTASTSLVTWAHLVQDPETLEVAGSSAVPHWHPHNSQARQGQLGKWPEELQGTPCASETALCKCGMWKFGAIGIPVEVKWSRTPVLLSGWTTKVYTIYIYTNSQIHAVCLKWRIFGNHRQAKSSLPLLKWCDHATWCYTHLWRRTTRNYLQLAMATSARCPPHLPKQIHRFYLSGKKWNEWCSSPLLGKQDAKCYHMNLVPGLHWNYHLPFGNTPQLDWKAFPKCYRWYLHGSSLEKHAACCRCKFASNKGSSHPSHIVRYVPITSNYIALYPTPTTSTRSPSYPHYLPIISPLMLLRVEQTKSQLALVEFPFVGCWTLNFATCSFKCVYIYI